MLLAKSALVALRRSHLLKSATTTSTTTTCTVFRAASVVLQAFLESGRLLGVHARVVVPVAGLPIDVHAAHDGGALEANARALNCSSIW